MMLKLRVVARWWLLAVLAPVVLMAAAACTTSEQELIEGILQNVDSVNGEITIVTKDGRTVTLTIATEAPVEAEGASPALEGLELGATLEVEVDEDGQIALRIDARQAKIEGTITEIDGNKVTVETERGLRRTITVTEDTRIELDEDFPGTLADLQLGMEVKVKFDPDSLVAFRFDTEEEEEKAEVEGTIVVIAGSEVTIETERGRRLTVTVGDGTRIELEEDLPGTLENLLVGIEVEVKFDPFTRSAFKIEVEEVEEEELEGTVVAASGSTLTIETEDGRRLNLTVGDGTRIELEDEDFPGTLEDLQVGVEIEAKFDQATMRASKIEVKEERENGNGGSAEIEGRIVSIEGQTITVENENGRQRTLTVTDDTRIKLDDDITGALADLREGLEVEVEFDPATDVAQEIEVED